MCAVGPRRVGVLSGLALAAASALVLATSPAHADDVLGLGPSEPLSHPPATHRAYIQYGVALAAEVVASAGPICSNVQNCIIGSGGGAAIRVGYRPDTEIYVGGVYEFSKQDASELYRLAILQQVGVEARRYFPTGREISPFLLVGLGVEGYGNEWSIDTWGPNATIGGGAEFELGGPVLGLTVAYRPMYFEAWVDSSTISHGSGIAHFVSLQVSLEARDAL
jgi:hypothetical protein